MTTRFEKLVCWSVGTWTLSSRHIVTGGRIARHTTGRFNNDHYVAFFGKPSFACGDPNYSRNGRSRSYRFDKMERSHLRDVAVAYAAGLDRTPSVCTSCLTALSKSMPMAEFQRRLKRLTSNQRNNVTKGWLGARCYERMAVSVDKHFAR